MQPGPEVIVMELEEDAMQSGPEVAIMDVEKNEASIHQMWEQAKRQEEDAIETEDDDDGESIRTTGETSKIREQKETEMEGKASEKGISFIPEHAKTGEQEETEIEGDKNGESIRATRGQIKRKCWEQELESLEYEDEDEDEDEGIGATWRQAKKLRQGESEMEEEERESIRITRTTARKGDQVETEMEDVDGDKSFRITRRQANQLEQEDVQDKNEEISRATRRQAKTLDSVVGMSRSTEEPGPNCFIANNRSRRIQTGDVSGKNPRDEPPVREHGQESPDSEEQSANEEVDNPRRFRSQCWECKFGRFMARKNGMNRCRKIQKHTECDWDLDPRAKNILLARKHKKLLGDSPPSVAGRQGQSRFNSTCWKCGRGSLKHRKHSRRTCREKLGHTGPDWRLVRDQEAHFALDNRGNCEDKQRSAGASTGHRYPRRAAEKSHSKAASRGGDLRGRSTMAESAGARRIKDHRARSNHLRSMAATRVRKGSRFKVSNKIRDRCGKAMANSTRRQPAQQNENTASEVVYEERGGEFAAKGHLVSSSDHEDQNHSATRTNLTLELEKVQEDLIAVGALRREDARQFGLLAEGLRVSPKHRSAIHCECLSVLCRAIEMKMQEQVMSGQGTKELLAGARFNTGSPAAHEDQNVAAAHRELCKATRRREELEIRRREGTGKLEAIKGMMQQVDVLVKSINSQGASGNVPAIHPGFLESDQRCHHFAASSQSDNSLGAAVKTIIDFATAGVPSAEQCEMSRCEVASAEVRLIDLMTSQKGSSFPKVECLRRFQQLVQRLMKVGTVHPITSSTSPECHCS